MMKIPDDMNRALALDEVFCRRIKLRRAGELTEDGYRAFIAGDRSHKGTRYGRVDLTVFVEEQSGLRIRLEFNLT